MESVNIILIMIWFNHWDLVCVVLICQDGNMANRHKYHNAKCATRKSMETKSR